MSKPFVLVAAPTVSDHALRPLREAGWEYGFMSNPVTEASLISAFRGRKVDAAIIRASPPFTAAVLDAAKDLRIISKNGAGIESVDIPAATARGVAVMISAGANADAVAEQSLALMLAMARELLRFDAGLRKGQWKDLNYEMRDFGTRTVGIVGYGQIGRRTARLAAAFGAKILVHSRKRPELPAGMEWEGDLDRLVARADILSLHCSLTPETRGMIDARRIALMKPDAIIVNTARGQLIDEPALVAALREKRIAGAALDVFAVEPADPKNPLFALPNVLCTPHTGSMTLGAAAQLGVITASNILYWFRGEVYDAQNFLNPEVPKMQ